MQSRYPLIAAVAAFAVVLACSKSSSASSPTADSPADSVLAKRADQGRIMGRATAPVWLVEVSDFQCPFCKQWHDQSYGEIKRAYVDSGKVRLADKFWPLHDALFATQLQWEKLPAPQQMFDSLASAAGVDMGAFHKCVSGHLMKATIDADIDRATKAGVESTPTFLIGGTMVTGAQPLAVFRQVLDSALALARAGKH